MTGSTRIAVVLASAMLAGCHDEHWLTYPWDDRRVLCSDTIDDLRAAAPWDIMEDQMEVAERTGAVLTLHAHTPGVTISVAAIQRVLLMAEQHHLAYLTYRELDAGGPPRAGLALAFDDNAIDAWFGVRGLLAARGAHVTFFVTRWYSRSDQEAGEPRRWSCRRRAPPDPGDASPPRRPPACSRRPVRTRCRARARRSAGCPRRSRACR